MAACSVLMDFHGNIKPFQIHRQIFTECTEATLPWSIHEVNLLTVSKDMQRRWHWCLKLHICSVSVFDDQRPSCFTLWRPTESQGQMILLNVRPFYKWADLNSVRRAKSCFCRWRLDCLAKTVRSEGYFGCYRGLCIFNPRDKQHDKCPPL